MNPWFRLSIHHRSICQNFLNTYLILFHSSPFVGRRPSVEYLSGRHFLLLHIINMGCNGCLICYHIKYAFFMYEINILSTLRCAVNLDVSFIHLQQRRIEIFDRPSHETQARHRSNCVSSFDKVYICILPRKIMYQVKYENEDKYKRKKC